MVPDPARIARTHNRSWSATRTHPFAVGQLMKERVKTLLSPAFDQEISYAPKFALICSDEHETERQCMRRYQQIVRTNGTAHVFQFRPKLPRASGGICLEWHFVNYLKESLNLFRLSSRVARSSCPREQLETADRGDTTIFRRDRLEPFHHRRQTPQQIDAGVRIEQVLQNCALKLWRRRQTTLIRSAKIAVRNTNTFEKAARPPSFRLWFDDHCFAFSPNRHFFAFKTILLRQS